ncbi:L-asparaginase II protein [Melanomma pulvis-pyrius CBS 109.77]|uniref:L-asparaginase II protein n=1 Tax=Melanomma pulvis-pyrius CBS 109.77 TaxID=1314802 RepID=A0A6A6WXJ3_9PLEO|nr:L-asparaginase II protein [Melanomma pulvis-pyrius CBS 109.77]
MMNTTARSTAATLQPDTHISLENDCPSQKSEDVILTHRGGIIENTHRIHAAITDANGNLLYAIGDANRVVLARSAAKPVQSLAILETGAADRFDFSDADIALMSASHSSEARHILRAQSMLQKVDAEEGDLTCGGHPAISAAVNRAWIKEDYVPTGICNNCSGKHVGMIAGAIALGAPVYGYQAPGHAMQQRVKRAVEQMSGLSEDQVRWAVDGCNLPAPALPLKNMALMYARLAEAYGGDVKEESGQEDTRKHHLARIHKAMSAHPELVGGEGRFCTALMEAYGGLLVGKVGADACYGVAIRARPTSGTDSISEDRAIGIAVKIEDGNLDILYSAVPEILEKLNIGTKEMRHQLDSYHHPKILNTAGVVTGGVRHNFKLRRVEEIDARAV